MLSLCQLIVDRSIAFHWSLDGLVLVVFSLQSFQFASPLNEHKEVEPIIGSIFYILYLNPLKYTSILVVSTLKVSVTRKENCGDKAGNF